MLQTNERPRWPSSGHVPSLLKGNRSCLVPTMTTYLGEKQFSNFRKREKPVKQRAYKKDPEHLEWIRTLPCCICGQLGCDPHHLLSAPGRGIAMKAPDWWVVPLTRDCHDRLHRECASKTEEDWFIRQGVQPHVLARILWHNSGDNEVAHWVLL